MELDIASVVYSVRTGAGLSRKELGEALEVSEKTIKNWEDGISEPNASLFLSMFFACNKQMEKEILKLKYPGMNGDAFVNDENARQMLITYVRSEMSSDSAKKLLYCLVGEHGSDTGAQINLCCAYNHFSMEDKYEICKMIIERYELRRDQGRLIRTDKPLPDLWMLKTICGEVRNEVTGKAGYNADHVKADLYNL